MMQQGITWKNVLSFCQQVNATDLGELIAKDYPVYEMPEDQRVTLLIDLY